LPLRLRGWSEDAVSAECCCSGGTLLTDAEQLCLRTERNDVTYAQAAEETFDALAGLVDKSLLTRVETAGRTRLHMLETVRTYGQERLTESGKTDVALHRHRMFYLGLAAQAGAAYGSSQQARWLRRLRPEHPNLRQILIAPPPAGEPVEAVLHASRGLWLHCLTSGTVGEGAYWMRKIIERHPQPPYPEATTTWCLAAWVAGFIFLLHGDHHSTQEMIGRGERALADMSTAPSVMTNIDSGASPVELESAFLQLRSLAALLAGDTENSERYALSCLARGHQSAQLMTRQQCTAQLGFGAVLQGDHVSSTRLLEQALAMSEAQGDTWHRCYLLWGLAIDRGEAGRPKEALRLLHRALHHTRAINEHLGEAALSEAAAWVLASCGHARSAAVVLGAVDRVWRPSGAPRLFGFSSMTAHRERGLQEAHRSLGELEYTLAYEEGQRHGLHRALEAAFRDIET
jgi:non-specific serine/threonine protein kinase